MTTTISNIQISTKGKTPGEVTVTVTADVINPGTNIPTCTFPAQSEGLPMKSEGGDAWKVSDTQMYDDGEKTVTVNCNGASGTCSFKS